MSEFNIRSDTVDVEQIMDQIRSRIRDKRGIDYTEEQIRELANVKLERFLDPKNVRSDLLEHYRKRGNKDPDRPTDTDHDVLYRSHRPLLVKVRRLLSPVLKLFINVGELNLMAERTEKLAAKLQARAELDALTYEVLNNLVVEMTRLSIDVKNHKMRVESVAARLDFDERRARALEEVVQQGAVANAKTSTRRNASPDTAAGQGSSTEGTPDQRRRRRRRPRRRTTGDNATTAQKPNTSNESASGVEPVGSQRQTESKKPGEIQNDAPNDASPTDTTANDPQLPTSNKSSDITKT